MRSHQRWEQSKLPINCKLVSSPKEQAFGRAKMDSLPRYCQECEVRFACHGGCPKNRFIDTPDGEAGLNYLCAGYKAFFNHVHPAMSFMSQQLRYRRSPAHVMTWMQEQDKKQLEQALATANRNDPCPCGSGKKYKACCMRKGL